MCGGVKSCKFGAWAGILTPLTPYLWGPMHYMAHKECPGKKGALGSFRRLRSKNNKWAVPRALESPFSPESGVDPSGFCSSPTCWLVS